MTTSSDDSLVRDLGDRRRRPAAVSALKRRGEHGRTAVTGALANPDPAVRKAALNILGVIGGDVVPSLRDPDPEVRGAAADAAQKLRPPTGTMLGMLEEAQPFVRAAAAEALAGLDTPEVVAALTRAASDADRDVRAAAIRSLGGHAPEVCICALRDPEPGVRMLAAHALRGAAFGLQALIAALHDPNALVRQEAAWSLGNAPAAVPALIEALRRGESAAARALGETKAEEAVPALIAALDDARTAGPAAQALGKIGDARAIPGLRRLAACPRPPDLRPDDRDPAGLAQEALSRLLP